MLALHSHSTKPLPIWYSFLVTAKNWNCLPWELIGGERPNRLLWWLRMQAYDAELARAARTKAKHG